KSDNNNFEAEQTSNFVSDLAREALNRYKNLGK
ncbi:MAG: HNH endonuclease, partial [Cyanobacteria bacterium SW_5_48_44]